jgi:uncharacterized protein YgiM (DUF1202 family)
MALSLIKTGVIAATAILMSASASMAASAYVDKDALVKKSWSSQSKTVGYVEEGDYVKVLDYTKKNGGWFKINPPGPNNTGWVKKNVLDLDYDDYDPDPGVEFCFTGPLGYICVKQ